MSWGVLPWVYPFWNSLGFLDLGDYFLPHFREVCNYYLLNYFLMVFLSSSSGIPIIWMLGRFILSWRSLRLSSFLLIRFSFFLSAYFYHSIFYFTNPIFCLCYSTIVASRVSLILFIALLIMYWLFFISSRSLFNLFCIFSILSPGYLSVIPFLFQDFGSFSLSIFGILSQVDSLFLPPLFGLVGISPVPLTAEYSSISSSWLYCCIWCGLSIFWEFVELSLLWSFLTVSVVVSVACQGFLVREACVGVLDMWSWVSSLWSAVEWPVMGYETSKVLE